MAYTTCPICVPARASFMTGKYVHQIGYWDNAMGYDGSIPGWGHRLRQEGIPVESIGKLHFRNENDDTGFDRQAVPMHIKDGIGQVWGSVRDPLLVLREGGEEMVSYAGAGTSDYNKYDLAITQQTCEWLKNRGQSSNDRPWVLYVGLVAPYFPYIVPEKFFNMYPVEEMKKGHAHPEDGYVRHPWVERFLKMFPGRDQNSDEERRVAVATYYGLCSFLDHNIGRMLDVLSQTGLAENTRIIYTSDHGDMIGSRGQWGKCLHYDDSAGIPLIIAGAYMLRQGQFKYNYYVGYDAELLDLSNDPLELKNLAANKEYADRVRDFEQRLREILDPEAVDKQARSAQARLIEKFGGVEKALLTGTQFETPPPEV